MDKIRKGIAHILVGEIDRSPDYVTEWYTEVCLKYADQVLAYLHKQGYRQVGEMTLLSDEEIIALLNERSYGAANSNRNISHVERWIAQARVERWIAQAQLEKDRKAVG